MRRMLADFFDAWLVRLAGNARSPFLERPMNITRDHWLEGARREVLAGGAAMETRRFLVIHFTGGWGADTSVDFWRTAAAKGANAHVVIDRDGSVIQCRAFNRTCGHAGTSRWKDPKTGKLHTALNGCSIGIELANCGDLVREIYPSTAGVDFSGKTIPRMEARHKNGGAVKVWEEYPLEQLKACEEVAKALVARYRLDDVVGHDDIAPERKNDPGPAFPMEALRQACGFRGLPGKDR